nr:MAG TPA: hypothetical protein [Caudoviricetes sp.]
MAPILLAFNKLSTRLTVSMMRPIVSIWVQFRRVLKTSKWESLL